MTASDSPHADGCITCGDVAAPVHVLEVRGTSALCADASGDTREVAVDLVDPVHEGDRLLVHAGVAIATEPA